MIRLFILVEDVTAVMAAGYTHIRVYTDVTSTGTFVTLDGSTALVAGQESYEYTDLNGTNATWYKTAYWGAVPGLSDKSDARKGETSSAYATVKELRAHIDKTAIVDDWELAQLLDTASRNIDRACNRPDGFFADVEASAREYPGSGTNWQYIDDAVSVTAVRLKTSATDTYTALAATDWKAAAGDRRYPEFSPLAKGRPYTALLIDPNGDYSIWYSDSTGYPTVEVTAYWGYSATIPHDIKIACAMQAARWYKRAQSAMSDTLASGELGMLMYTQSLDPDIKRLLVDGRYVKPATGRR